MKRVVIVAVACVLVTFGRIGMAKPVAVWPMDESKGDTVKDTLGQHAADGKFVGGVSWAAGKFGSAVEFDGSTAHIEIPDPTHNLNPPQMTLMAWINPSNVAGTHSILEQYDWAGALGCHAFRMEGGQLQLWVIWGAGGENALGGALTANEWQHVASTYDGQTIRLFVNGKMTAEKQAAKKDLAASDKALSIGVRGDTKDIHWFAGLIDDVAIFDEALAEEELMKIATASGGIATAYLAVDPAGKASTTWAAVKASR
ncbi:MAG: LamG domain-containing protein [Candidatus Poribacteria bacterium]|nr:LamG domain-containing protein [Candidatus Poribacteria bacterium]